MLPHGGALILILTRRLWASLMSRTGCEWERQTLPTQSSLSFLHWARSSPNFSRIKSTWCPLSKLFHLRKYLENHTGFELSTWNGHINMCHATSSRPGRWLENCLIKQKSLLLLELLGDNWPWWELCPWAESEAWELRSIIFY